MITLVPLECSLLILNHLRHKNLLSCALVSRPWCKLIIPILWCDPKHHFQDERLINTLLLMLSPEERTLVDNFNVQIPNNQPVLEYTNFITYVTRDLYNGVRCWITSRQEAGVGTAFEDLINYSLIRLLLRTGKNLRYIFLEELNCNYIVFKNTTITSLDLYFSDEIHHRDVSKSIEGLIKNINGNTTLTTLNIILSFLGEGLKALTKALCKNNAINSFSIHQLRLNKGRGRMLRGFLRKNTTITSLSLCRSPFKNGTVPELGKSLAVGLRINKTLKHLKVQYYNFGSEEGRLLADVLYTNTTLLSLDLVIIFIRQQGEQALAEALCKNTTLMSFNLHNNFIKLEEGQILADVLCKNTTLISLDLSHNNLRLKGGKALAKAFFNTSLIDLNLENNNIGFKGENALEKALKDACHENIKLTSLKLQV
ncbi:hypothetical protein C2G38_2193929 [Gigaspora rosea]|uniref:F-box domain-containing protein n=1 Tax=Gigaspora rosea TaxID=44941 RepID=A0A397V4I0_9GLOM|nr:hypothetical protein C2G38_2193929 [Gigaspora rosea]